MTEIPPSLRAALDAPPVPPKSWQDGVAPAFVSLWISVVFLDRLAMSTLLVGGLVPSLAGAVLGGVLGYWGLYYAPVIWGAEIRRPFNVVATSTFGARGALWLPGVLIGLIAIVWFAVTIDAATEWSMSGLSALGFIDPKELLTAFRGQSYRPRPVFLFVAGVWSITSAILGTLAVRLVAAIMLVYPIFAAIALGLTLVWAIPTASLGPVAARPLDQGGLSAILTMAQLVFAFLAANAMTAADWGAATKTVGDARIGGLVGVMIAAPLVASVGLLIVAGGQGHRTEADEPVATLREFGASREISMLPPTPPRTLREVFLNKIGGRLGGTGLLVLSLALLGPACFTPFVIARQFSAVWPKIPRLAITTTGAVASWPLIVSGLSRNTNLMFGLMAAAAAPVVGAIAADYALRKGRWPGPRRGVNLAGVIAWSLGLVAGLVPYLGFPGIQPASVLAFFVAFAAYLVLALARLEPPALDVEIAPPAS